MKRIKFTHWQDENRELVEVGELPATLNNPQSDKYVLQTARGDFIDIRKETVLEIEDVN
jgi:hypothetical protein